MILYNDYLLNEEAEITNEDIKKQIDEIRELFDKSLEALGKSRTDLNIENMAKNVTSDAIVMIGKITKKENIEKLEKIKAYIQKKINDLEIKLSKLKIELNSSNKAKIMNKINSLFIKFKKLLLTIADAIVTKIAKLKKQ